MADLVTKNMSIVDQIKAAEASDVAKASTKKDQPESGADDKATKTEAPKQNANTKEEKPMNTPNTPDDVSDEIFKDIPLPSSDRSRKSKYKWDELEVGDAFFVAEAKLKSFVTQVSTRNKKGGEKGPKFIAREAKHPKTGIPGVMVWRKS